MTICYPLSTAKWMQNEWPWMTLSGYFMKKCVFGQHFLNQSVWMSEIVLPLRFCGSWASCLCLCVFLCVLFSFSLYYLYFVCVCHTLLKHIWFDLIWHIRRHEDVKPYVCSECPKCFCSASNLKSHKLRHSDVKHFSCGKSVSYTHLTLPTKRIV